MEMQEIPKEQQSKQNQTPPNELLYPGMLCQLLNWLLTESKLTNIEAQILLSRMILEHKLNNTIKEQLLDLINCFLPTGNINFEGFHFQIGCKIASSVYKLEQLLDLNYTRWLLINWMAQISRMYHFDYCSACFHLYKLEDSECPNCHCLRFKSNESVSIDKKMKDFFLCADLQDIQKSFYAGSFYR